MNDENVVVAINSGLIETIGEMLIFQSQNLINIDRNVPNKGMIKNMSGIDQTMPQYLRILIRNLTSMIRSDVAIVRLLSSQNCKFLMAIVSIMKFSREEELVANSMKVIRQAIKDENNL